MRTSRSDRVLTLNRRGRGERIFAGVLTLGLLACSAMAQELRPPRDPDAAIAELNAIVGTYPADERAEDVILPAIAEMDAPPVALRDQFAAAMVGPGQPGWSDASAWALAAPQRAVIEAMKSVSEPDSRYVFSLPYGDEASERFREEDLHVELGPENLLVGANFLYLDGLTDIGRLVHVEATRLGGNGQIEEAIDLLLHWSRFCRMIADREFADEKLWALRSLNLGLERIRDVMFAHPESRADPDVYRDAIADLGDREIEVDRIRLPRAEKWAALQLIGRVMEERGGPAPETFGPTMARLATGDRPLQLFGQAARWQRMAENHADWFGTLDELAALLKDRELRWGLSPHDPVLQTKSEYDRLDAARHALLLEAVTDPHLLRQERLFLRTELEGTRVALGINGYRSRYGAWPPTLFAIRGAASGFIREFAPDPYLSDIERSSLIGVKLDPLEYFVPIRDTHRSAREDPRPHQITVNVDPAIASMLPGGAMDAGEQPPADADSQDVEFSPEDVEAMMREAQQAIERMTPDRRRELEQRMQAAIRSGADQEEILQIFESSDEFGEVLEAVRAAAGDQGGGDGSQGAGFAGNSFTVSLTDETFVLYSVGPDGEDDRAASVGPGGEDYLLYPPLMGLLREQMNR